MRLYLGSAALLGTLACGVSPTAPELPPAAARRPSLEQIFLEPPLFGVPPRMKSLSPDGEWLIFAWSPDAVESTDGELRLLRTSDPEATAGRGTPLAQLLSKEEEPAIQTAVWARRQPLLAIARGRELWFLDPATGASTLVCSLPAAPDEAGEVTEEDSTEDAKDTEKKDKPGGTGRIVSLAFARDQSALRFSDRQELYSIPMPEIGVPAAVAWEDVQHISAGLKSAALALQWSRSLEVVFDPELAFEADAEEAEEEATEDAEDTEDTGDEFEAPAQEQVEFRSEGRRITLAGMPDIEWLENERLSPDGRFVFGREVDRSDDPEPTLVPNFLSDRVTTREGRRRLAEDGPAPWKLWVWKTSSGEQSEVEQLGPEPATNGDATPSTGWFRSIGWAPLAEAEAPARFAFQVVSEDFHELSIWCWTEGFCERIWFERDERWVGGPARFSRWSADGRCLLIGSESYAHSTTPGRSQLFAVDPDTKEVRQLTQVDGEVTGFKTIGGGGVAVQASGADLASRYLLRLSRADVHGTQTPNPRVYAGMDEGWNSVPLVSRSGERIVFDHESLFGPAELWSASKAGAQRLTRTIPAAFQRMDWIEPERITVKAPDGSAIQAHVYLPRGVTLESPGRARPTIVFVHGAGYLQNVTESMTRYPLNMMFHSRLADLGYPVIDVDYRGSAGYGQSFRTDVQYHLGGLDLDDIHTVVDELVATGLVDPERVGLYGGSYGGFLTMMALFTAPERWAAGAALRSVTDWRTYHPGYTQPRLGRPSTHAEAYARSSPIDLVDGLEDPLLILHGMRDSNVFAQDSIRLIEALIDRGLDFDAMLYPSQGHGFTDGPHWLDEYRRIERFLLEHLGQP